jgi:hypothetical protein
MRRIALSVFALALASASWQMASNPTVSNGARSDNTPSRVVEKGAKWLVSVQGPDGGWGQDGGATSYVRQGERLETTGNDVANTAVAALALLQAGNGGDQYRPQVEKAVRFILSHMDKAPPDSLAITDITGTQIQRKLGPYIDTFLTSMLLSELDGNIKDPKLSPAVRRGLQLCVSRIEKFQQGDGSWNFAGGWAPILGTSMASRSLYNAQVKGLAVNDRVMEKAELYAKAAMTPAGSGGGVGTGAGAGTGRIRVGGDAAGVVGGVPGGVAGGVIGGIAAAPRDAVAVSAGVPLYQSAQVLEQLSRTEVDRKKNAREIKVITSQLSSDRFVSGFGSMGGEEFFSYLNISDSLHRTGGEPWTNWNNRMKTQLVKLQNEDGTWAGHHCITGRVAVTSAAMLTLMVERKPATGSLIQTKYNK